MKNKLTVDDVVIIRRNKNKFDVFTGDFGWDTWSCFELQKHKVVLVAGESVEAEMYTKLRKLITKEMNQ